VRCKTGGLGFSVKALRIRASEVNLHSLPKGAKQSGLPKELVLYCARHDYGTRVPMRTGNLAAVMRTMGHRDVNTAMHYQHPELEIVRAALDYRPPTSEAAE
jgi:site-specific recombinase XerC